MQFYNSCNIAFNSAVLERSLPAPKMQELTESSDILTGKLISFRK